MSTDLPLTLTVVEAASVLRIGRTSAYNLVRCGRLRSIRCGKIIRIPREAIFEFLNS
jgi:excisionase family DNA binding protein